MHKRYECRAAPPKPISDGASPDPEADSHAPCGRTCDKVSVPSRRLAEVRGANSVAPSLDTQHARWWTASTARAARRHRQPEPGYSTSKTRRRAPGARVDQRPIRPVTIARVRITALHLRNFKSFADSGPIELGAVNVLVGRNNSGKSAVLRALYQLQDGSIGDLYDIRLGNATAEITADVENLEARRFTNSAEIRMQSLSLRAALTRSESSGWSTTFEANTPAGGSFQTQFAGVEPNNFIHPYFARRKVASLDQQVNARTVSSVVPDHRHLVAKVHRAATPTSPFYDYYVEGCKRLIGFVASTVTTSPNGLQLGRGIGGFDAIPVEAMGDGVVAALGLLTTLCVAEGQLLLIEEVENDLHPAALKTLLNLLAEKSSTNQVVVTTHSNVVLQRLGSLPDARVFHVTLDDSLELPASRINTVPNQPTERLRVLADLGYELSDYDLWDGWLFVEESSAQSILERFLIPWFAPGLATRLRVVSAGGVTNVEPHFTDFRRLFLFAHLEVVYEGRAWVVVDNDDRGRDVVARLRASYPSWPEDHFRTWRQPNFEEYYPPLFRSHIDRLATMDRDAKRLEKRDLLNAVMSWAAEDPTVARREFESSAAEVILLLRAIESKLVSGEVQGGASPP
jgi:hypothetical protein